MFKVRLDTISTLITLTGAVLCTGISVYFVWSFIEEGRAYNLVPVFVIVSILLYFLSQLPTKLRLSNNGLVIDQIFGSKKIDDISRMYSVSHLPSMTYSTKGFLGYQGSTMDDFKSLVADRHNIIAIEAQDKKYLVSCSEPEKLINLWKDKYFTL